MDCFLTVLTVLHSCSATFLFCEMSLSRERDSDGSEDDAAARKRRSTRACDQCRKTKSKCERLSDTQCANCAAFGQVCSFVGPSYKRGPPKGYIHAIEQRMQHYEALLGVIMSTSDSRAQGLLSDLRQDELARGILNRVDAGRFGPAGRGFHINGQERSPTRESRSSRRQSRITREFVSNEDVAILQPPTTEWQDRLCSRLESCRSSFASFTGGELSPTRSGSVSSPGTHSISTDGDEHVSQRRKLGPDFVPFDASMPGWEGMYTMESSEEDRATDDGYAAFGQLSLDEHREIRFHGKASGLHLLNRSDRTDHRNEGGVWHFPMARVWPPAKDDIAQLLQEQPEDVTMPSLQVQEHLVDLYFTYMHPIFPVIHKEQFLNQWTAIKNGYDTAHDGTKMTQNVSNLLLLSMFTIAARYLDDDQVPTNGKMWESGCNYLADAQRLLNRVFHYSRPSTIQALLLLGVREFGIGSMEHGWIYLAMARAMAQDLGLNRSADKWKINGRDIFTKVEKQVRKRIWWACCITDKIYGIYMGRAASIREGDFDTALPEVDQAEEEEMWPPPTHPEIEHVPAPAVIMTCFRAWASLSVIIGTITDNIYPVKATSRIPRRTWLSKLESQLDQWYLDLPDCLRYATATKRVIPPPNVLRLHINYWATVLLLHRAFIPNWKSPPSVGKSVATSDTAALKAFDLCQNAASRVCSIVTAFREKFTLRRTSPFLTPSLLSAGIMHIVTLSLRPSNVQASMGLQQSLEALKDMEIPWPAAKRSYDLLHGVKLQFDNVQAFTPGDQGRNKRPASDAFDKERISDVIQREAFGPPNNENNATSGIGENVGVQDLSTQLMAHILGLDVSGVVESTSYFPGYRWWPRMLPEELEQEQPGQQQQSPEAWPMEAFGMEPAPNFNYETQEMGAYQQYGCPGDVVQNGLFYNLQDLM